MTSERRYLGGRLVMVCLLLLSASARATERLPMLERVTVAPFSVETAPYPGAPARVDEQSLLGRLSREATARAGRTLLKQGIAGHVDEAPSTSNGSPEAALTGFVRLPVSLPPGHAGGRAMFRKGTFATATVVLRAGSIVRQREVELDWREVRWIRGRTRRSRKLDDVLVDAVRKVVDRAVKALRGGPDGSANGGSGTEPLEDVSLARTWDPSRAREGAIESTAKSRHAPKANQGSARAFDASAGDCGTERIER